MSVPTRERRWLDAEMPSQPVRRPRVPTLRFVLAAIIFGIFRQTCRRDFVDFDDNKYVDDDTVGRAPGLTLKTSSGHSRKPHPVNRRPST
jgi:hypothetical protein